MKGFKFDNDRLSHWLAGAVISWALFFALCSLICYFGFGASIKKVAAFSALACVIQLAVTPGLFSARATRQNPKGQRSKRWIIIAIFLTLYDLLFNYFVMYDPASNLDAKIIFFGGPLILGTVALIILVALRRREKTN